MDLIIYRNNDGAYYTGFNGPLGPVFSKKFELAKVFTSAKNMVETFPESWWSHCSVINAESNIAFMYRAA